MRLTRRVDRRPTAPLAIGVAACGGDNGAVRTVTVPAVEQDAPVTGDAILIETRVTNARKHTGKMSSLGP